MPNNKIETSNIKKDSDKIKDMGRSLQESEEKHRLLFEKSGVAVGYFTPEGQVISINNLAANQMDGKPEDFTGSTLHELFGQETGELYISRIKEACNSTSSQTYEDLVSMPLGKMWFNFTFHAISDTNENIIGVQIIGHDITQRKQAEEKIKASLREKETLLQEIHHRVKNNMQVISSLLKLQSNNYEDESIKRPLLDSQNRVKAMAAVHENLYKSKNLSSISVLPFLKELTSSIIASYQLSKSNTTLEIDSDDISISIEQASPLGLIINELVSNSLKYAFPGERQGKIWIKINRMNNEDIYLRYSDDGIGFPSSVDWRDSESLGLKLIVNLVENQLDGSIKMKSDRGTHFDIIFNEDHI